MLHLCVCVTRSHYEALWGISTSRSPLSAYQYLHQATRIRSHAAVGESSAGLTSRMANLIGGNFLHANNLKKNIDAYLVIVGVDVSAVVVVDDVTDVGAAAVDNPVVPIEGQLEIGREDS